MKIMGIKDTAEAAKMIANLAEEAAKSGKAGQGNDRNRDDAKKTIDILNDIKNLNTSSLEGTQKRNADLMKFLSQGSMQIATGLKGILTKSFEVTEMIYKKLVASSPLLQAIENLFNLAWSLFFMPIGNKLGELLIPAVIELMDGVMAFWEEYGNGGLGDMVSHAVTEGVKLLGDFFGTIGDALAEQTGWVGAIGRFLQGLGRFIENNGERLLDLVLNWAVWNIEHLGTMITLIGSFMSLHYALQTALMLLIAGGTPWQAALGGVIIGGIGVGASAYLGSQLNMAEGGYVPATDGGMMVRVAEGGQGEYVIPESRVVPLDQALTSVSSNVPSLGSKSGNSYIVNVYSYSIEEIKAVIKDVLSDEISQSRLRSGY